MPLRHAALFLLASLTAVSAGEEPKRFSLERVKTASAALRTLRLPFVQEKRLAMWEEPLLTPGVIEVSRPLAAVRWEYTGELVLILKAGAIRRWNGEGTVENAGGERNPGTQALAKQMQAMLDSDWTALEELFVLTPDPDGTPVLRLEPRGELLREFVASMTLRFREDLLCPAELRLQSPSGDLTVYHFADPTIDPEIQEQRFAGP